MAREVPIASAGHYASEPAFRDHVMHACQPVVLKGAGRDWPLLDPGGPSIFEHMLTFDTGREAEMFVGPPGIGQPTA